MINIKEKISDHIKVFNDLHALLPEIEIAAQEMVRCINNNGKILWMGNGGSAADSQHLAAELVGRFERERKALPSIALTTDTSILTAVANDYEYNYIFSRQIEAFCNANDVVVGISTSGNSGNILEGLKAAKSAGAFTIGLTGRTGGKMREGTDLCLVMPSNNTARIQEAHIFIGHILCDWIEAELCKYFERG